MTSDDSAEQTNQPNWTRTPNLRYDKWARQITNICELKIVDAIIRETFGWHRNESGMTIEEFMQQTGLTRPSVIKGLRLAGPKGHGIIERVTAGRSFRYRLVMRPELKVIIPETPRPRQRALPLNVQSLEQSKQLTDEQLKHLTDRSVKTLNRSGRSPLLVKEKITHTKESETNDVVCVSAFSTEERTKYANAQNPKLGKGWIHVSRDGRFDELIHEHFDAEKRRDEQRQRKRFEQPATNINDGERATQDEIREMLKQAVKSN